MGSEEITEINQLKQAKVDEFIDEIETMVQQIRILEQEKDESIYAFELKMFNRCWSMVKEVIQLHYPDRGSSLKRASFKEPEKRLRRTFSKMLGFSIESRDL